VTILLYLFEQGILHFKERPFTMGPTRCPQTTLTTYQPAPRSISVERRPLFIWSLRLCNVSYKQLQTGLEGFPFLPLGVVHRLKVNRVPYLNYHDGQGPKTEDNFTKSCSIVTTPHSSIKPTVWTGKHLKQYSIKINTTEKSPEKHITSLNTLHVYKCKLSHRTDIQDTPSLCLRVCTGLSIISPLSVSLQFLSFQYVHSSSYVRPRDPINCIYE